MFRTTSWKIGWRLMVVVGLLLSTFGGFLALPSAKAADAVAVNGRVYNAETGAGYANVAVFLCGGNGYAYTDGNGSWHANVASGSGYCVRLVGAAPNGLVASAVYRRPDVGDADSYEYQYAGQDCYHKSSCNAQAQKWDEKLDTNLDIVYVASNKIPAPTPQASGPAASATPAAPVGPKAAPKDFAAKSGGDLQTVQLRWKPAQDAAQVKAYVLERSVDEQTWQVLADNLTAQEYQDTTVQPNVHYFYRLHATLVSGDATDPAKADVVNGEVLGATSGTDRTVTSSDKLATATVTGVANDVACMVSASDQSVGSSDRPMIVGPYVLSCKTAGGDAVSNVGTVTWVLKVGDRMKGLESPTGTVMDADGKVRSSGGTYDKAAGAMKLQAKAADLVGVRAVVPDRTWVNYVIIVGFVVLVLVVLAFVPLRTKNQQSYREYLRSKYYNL